MLTQYLLDSQGRTAQLTAANQAALGTSAFTLYNLGNSLVLSGEFHPVGNTNSPSVNLATALGCDQYLWRVPDLTDPSGAATATALALNEIQASMSQVVCIFI